MKGMVILNFKKIAIEIMENVGGSGNISKSVHCATRLRINLVNEEKINKDELEGINGVLGIVQKGKELHIIIGQDVSHVYREFNHLMSNSDKNPIEEVENSSNQKKKKSFKDIGNVAINFVSGVFMPILPVLIASGLIMATNNILINFFNVQADGGTATVLTAISSAGFFYLPIFLGFYAAQKLDVSPALGALLGAILVSDPINGVSGLDFLGIPIYPAAYNSSTLPVIFGVLFLAFLDKKVDKYISDKIKYFLKPLIVMIITVPVTLIALAPIGAYLSIYMTNGLEWLNSYIGFLTVPLFAIFNPFMVTFGLDKALAPVILDSISSQGYETLILIGSVASNTAIGGSALAVWRLSKQNKVKQISLSAGITGVLGITEPALFGVMWPYKIPMIGAVIGGGIGGLFAGIVNLKQYAWVSPGLAAAPTFISPDGTLTNFIFFLLTVLISVVAGFIATTILSKYKNIEYI